eukprot:6812804-Lingulodinium_polyedra.AAC.1
MEQPESWTTQRTPVRSERPKETMTVCNQDVLAIWARGQPRGPPPPRCLPDCVMFWPGGSVTATKSPDRVQSEPRRSPLR